MLIVPFLNLKIHQSEVQNKQALSKLDQKNCSTPVKVTKSITFLIRKSNRAQVKRRQYNDQIKEIVASLNDLSMKFDIRDKA